VLKQHKIIITIIILTIMSISFSNYAEKIPLLYSNNAVRHVFDGFSAENITENVKKIETMLNNARENWNSRIYKDNQFYIEKLKLSNYTYYSNNVYTFRGINKHVIFTFDNIKKEWKIQNSELH
jgi:hypothetical protein